MKNEFTKGEWTLQRDNSITVGESIICQMGSANNNDKEKEANAKLIAAAPELLEALKVCYASLCTYGTHPIIDIHVSFAIKKATT